MHVQSLRLSNLRSAGNLETGAVASSSDENAHSTSKTASRERPFAPSEDFCRLSGPGLPPRDRTISPKESGGALAGMDESIGKILSESHNVTQEVALIGGRREFRAAFFRFVEAMQDRHAAAELLYTVIAAEGAPAYWMFRKRCVELLLERSGTPLLSSFNILLCAKDPLIKKIAMEEIATRISFPLSSAAREEVSALGAKGGKSLLVLLTEAPLVGEKPVWVSMYPGLVRSWTVACMAAGVESGITREELEKFDRNSNGPLNDWHIDRAVAPLTMFSGSWGLACIRRALGR